MEINKLSINNVRFVCEDIEGSAIELYLSDVKDYKEGIKVLKEFIDRIRRTPIKDISIG